MINSLIFQESVTSGQIIEYLHFRCTLYTHYIADKNASKDRSTVDCTL